MLLNEPLLDRLATAHPVLADHRARFAQKTPRCRVKRDAPDPDLEDFDATGRRRGRESSNRIDAFGTLPGGEALTGPAALMQVLAKHRGGSAVHLTQKMRV